MKNRRLFPALVLILVATIMAVTGFMLWESGNTAKLRQIHVIIENSNDNRWVQFIEGMKQAAEDQEVILTIVPTGHIETLSEEEAIVERAIANGRGDRRESDRERFGRSDHPALLEYRGRQHAGET